MPKRQIIKCRKGTAKMESRVTERAKSLHPLSANNVIFRDLLTTQRESVKGGKYV